MLNSLQKIELQDFEKLEEVVAPVHFGFFINKTMISIRNNISNSPNTTINNIFNFYFK